MTIDKPNFVSPGWQVLLHDVGVESRNVLRRAGLPADLFARPRTALSTEEYFRMWQGVAEESGDPLLPLVLGSRICAEAFDPPLFAALCSPDLNTALTRLAQYKRLIAAMKLHVTIDDTVTDLEFEWLDKSVSPPDALVLMELVFFVQLARLGTRTRVEALAVISPVVPEQESEYTAFLGTPIVHGPAPRLRFAHADATRPFLMANPKMWEFFEKDLQQRLSELNASATTAERVRAALLELLPAGGASIQGVAKRLGISGRTLQRRLKAEGQNFQRVLDRTREALAKHYLKTSAMTGPEISFLLGYEDPNSFFRAFNVWTGTTPERARRELRASCA